MEKGYDFDSTYLHGGLKRSDLGNPEDILKKVPVNFLGKDVELFDLSQPWGAGTPLWPYFQDYHIDRFHYHAKSRVLSQVITHTMHGSTHADAPIHVEEGYPYIDEVPVERYCGKGVVVSIPKKKWELIGAEDLENAEPAIERGDMVIINSGWHRYWGDNVRYFVYAPGLYREAGEWFVKKKVKAVGVDQQAIDHPLATKIAWEETGIPPILPWVREEYKKETGRNVMDDFPWWEPCHRLLYTHGIPGYENVGGDIDKVTGKRVNLIGLPIRWVKGDGSIVRLIAMVEKR